MIDYELVTTLGPSTNQAPVWKSLLSAGATTFRLNTSHLNLTELDIWLEALAAAFAPDMPPSVVLDLQGSKWRLGAFPARRLEAGQQVDFFLSSRNDVPGAIPVPHPDFFAAAPGSSGEINLNDARVRLALERVADGRLSAVVLQGGEVSSSKGITFTASDHRQETLNDKDQAIVAATRGLGWVRLALSYVKDEVEMGRYRASIGPNAYLVAKLEREPAVSQAAQIALAADELWLCRGDLGAELGLAHMAQAVYRFSRTVRELPRPVLIAGQVFEHLVQVPYPTRSEVCYLYEVLELGYHGLVLSDETAIGRYPLESCRAAALFKQPTENRTQAR